MEGLGEMVEEKERGEKNEVRRPPITDQSAPMSSDDLRLIPGLRSCFWRQNCMSPLYFWSRYDVFECFRGPHLLANGRPPG